MQRVVSDSDVIIHLAKLNKLKASGFRIHRNKPSDFAGAWIMSDEEEEEIKESLRGLWGTWKMD